MLIITFLAFVTIFGYIIGFAWLEDPTRALFGLALALVVGVVSGLVFFPGERRWSSPPRGAREISHDAPVLFSMVEEMSIASASDAEGLHRRRLRLERFATGRDPEHASVAVTSGLLEKLDRDELQGVMAREMSHVANFDIRYSMLVGILVGTTVLISDFFLRGLFRRGQGRRARGWRRRRAVAAQ